MNLSKFDEITRAKVLKAYLCDAKSHRRIQEEIFKMDAPARGGGFLAMGSCTITELAEIRRGLLVNRVRVYTKSLTELKD